MLFVTLLVGVGGAARDAAAGPDAPTDNAGWVEIGAGSASGGGISNNSGDSLGPSLAIGFDGTPVIAWMDDSSGDQEVYIKRWTGSAWAEIGSGSASGGGISNASGYSGWISLAITSEGVPIVAWNQLVAGKGEIYVRYWNRFTWAEMGVGSASGSGISQNGNAWDGKIVVGPDDTPVVAYVTNIGGEQVIHVRRWNGTGWGEMGSGSASDGGLINPGGYTWGYSMSITSDNRPVIAWQDYAAVDQEIYVRIWNGSEWVGLGDSTSANGISNNGGDSSNPSAAVGQDNVPVVVWSDDSSGNREIYVRHWNGTVWAELGTGSASGGGISNTSTPSFNVKLAIAPDNSPIVAWREEISSTNDQIFVRRWDGSAWVEMGTGSASGGGISDTTGRLFSPSIAADPDNRVMVAWPDDSSGNFEIYTRHSPQLPPTCHTLTRAHTGQGGDPTANPTNSTGCSTSHYIAGQPISLTASPAAGHRVKSWSGTDNNSSTATTNTVTMPANNHTISVTYEMIPIVNTEYFTFIPLSLRQPPPCFPGPHEQEPNNSQSQANGPLCRGRVYTGLPNDLWDMYYFDTTQSGEVTAAVTDIFGGGKQVMQLLLYYGAVGGNSVASDVDDGDGLSVTLPAAQPGRYYVVVYTKSPNPAETRPYRLSLSFP